MIYDIQATNREKAIVYVADCSIELRFFYLKMKILIFLDQFIRKNFTKEVRIADLYLWFNQTVSN